MHKIKEFVISNYSEILSVSSLFIIFLVLVLKFWNHFGLSIIDCGREAYFPEQILNGKILYKDIFNIFGPLSYQVNALFYKFFGISLNTLRLAGTINAFISVFLLYFITRLFTSRGVSWVVTIFIIIACAFCTFYNAFNYIFPYAYAMSYSFSAFLFSVLFSILYLKTSKQYLMPLSWFFLGISVVSKHDFIPYILFLVSLTAVMKYNKKLDIRYVIYSVIAFFTVPLISFSILFLQGLTFSEFLNQIGIVKTFARVPANIHFHTTVGFYPKKDNLLFILKSFCKIFPASIGLWAMVYFSLKYIKYILNIVFIIILYLNLFPQIMQFPVLTLSLWPLLTMAAFGFMLYRIMNNKKYSYMLTYAIFLVMAICISIKPDLFLNFYASSQSYALGAILFSFLFLIFYFKTSKQYFVPLSWFFLGISIVLEWKYIGFVILFTLLTIFIKPSKRINSKYILYSLTSFAIVPVINFLVALLQGLTISDLLIHVRGFRNVIFAFPFAVYYLKSTILYIPNYNPPPIFDLFGYIITSYMNLTVLAIGIICFSLKFTNINFDKLNKFVLGLSLLLILFYSLSFNNALVTYSLVFSGIPLFTTFILGIILFRLIKKKNIPNDSIYLALVIAALIASSKSFFSLNLYTYGPFTLPLLFIANSIFFVEYLPIWFKFIDKDLLKQSFVIIVLGMTLLAFINLINSFNKGYVIKTDKGYIYDGMNIAATVQETIDYVKKHLKPQDSVWVIPEGIMINFVTNHPANGTYYSTIPSYIETFGEDKIISDTQKNAPDYIIINDRKTADHGLPYMCEDYGFKICKYVKSHYTPVKKFFNESDSDASFTMIIYKRK